MTDIYDQVVYGAEPETKALMRALGIDSDLAYRVVIDIKSDAVAVAYVEMYASRKAIELLTNSPKGIDVKVVDKP